MMAYPPEPFASYIQDDQLILAELSIKMGLPLTNIMEIAYAADMVNANILMGEETPAWAVDALETTLSKYMAMSQIFFATEFMIKVRGGTVITEVVQNMEAIIDNADQGKQFLIYSGHDVNLHSLAHVLGVSSQILAIPNYADTMLLELVDNGGSEFQVQALYVDNSGHIPVRSAINIPGCGSACNFSTFKGLVAKFLISDWDELCAL